MQKLDSLLKPTFLLLKESWKYNFDRFEEKIVNFIRFLVSLLRKVQIFAFKREFSDKTFFYFVYSPENIISAAVEKNNR